MKTAAEVVTGLLEAVKRGDAAGVMDRIDPAVTVVEPASLPYGGVHKGSEAFKRDVFGVLLGRLTIEIPRCEVIGAGDKVAASMDLLFTSRKTGNKITMPYVEIYTCREGKVTRIDVYPQDTQELVAFLDAN